jgi:hypothetical protein
MCSSETPLDFYPTKRRYILDDRTPFSVSFMLVSWLAYSCTLKIGVICSSETSIDFHRLDGVISQKTEIYFLPASCWILGWLNLLP